MASGRRSGRAAYGVAQRMGREASPSAAVLDSQSVKSAEKGAAKTTRLVTTPVSRSRAAKSMPWSTAKGCRWGSSSTPRRSRTATGPCWSSTRYADAPLARTDLGRWWLQHVASRSCGGKGAAAAHRDRQAERRHEGLCRPAAPLGGSSAPSAGSDETGVSPKTSRTLPRWLATFVTLASIQLALRRLARA